MGSMTPAAVLVWRFVVGLMILGGAMRLSALVFFSKDAGARRFAGWTETVGKRAMFLVGAVFGASAIPGLLSASREKYGDLVWGLRLGAAACAGGSLLLLWLAFAPRKRR
jgi:hypothetical protein